MTTPPMSQVHALLEVAHHRSFTAAARELGVSRSAVSQAIRQLEQHLGTALVARTTRSVSLTDAGRRLVEGAAPAVAQLLASLQAAGAQPGETAGRLRLSVPRVAISLVLDPVIPVFRRKHPRVEVELTVDDRLVDIVETGYDAGIRMTEVIERDMVQLRLTAGLRFVVVGSPQYLAERGTPQRPEDLLEHECITFRSPTTGALYAWELERGRRTWRMAVGGGVIANDPSLAATLAAAGLGLTYVAEPSVTQELNTGRLEIVLDEFAAAVPGFFLYYPSRAQRSAPLAAFIETAREVLKR